MSFRIRASYIVSSLCITGFTLVINILFWIFDLVFYKRDWTVNFSSYSYHIMFCYQGDVNIVKAKKSSLFPNFWKGLHEMLGDLQTLFFIKPFELCTYYPHFIEEAEAQRERKWTARVMTQEIGGKARIQIQVLVTLKLRLFAYSIPLWTRAWMAEWVGILRS